MNATADPRLVVQAAPFLHPTVSTPRIMGDVLIALAPATAAGLWFFGLSALLVVLASTAACVATDWALGGRAQLADLSAVVTGVLVGLRVNRRHNPIAKGPATDLLPFRGAFADTPRKQQLRFRDVRTRSSVRSPDARSPATAES